MRDDALKRHCFHAYIILNINHMQKRNRERQRERERKNFVLPSPLCCVVIYLCSFKCSIHTIYYIFCFIYFYLVCCCFSPCRPQQYHKFWIFEKITCRGKCVRTHWRFVFYCLFWNVFGDTGFFIDDTSNAYKYIHLHWTSGMHQMSIYGEKQWTDKFFSREFSCFVSADGTADGTESKREERNENENMTEHNIWVFRAHNLYIIFLPHFPPTLIKPFFFYRTKRTK